jgi:hypothetical protein
MTASRKMDAPCNTASVVEQGSSTAARRVDRRGRPTARLGGVALFLGISASVPAACRDPGPPPPSSTPPATAGVDPSPAPATVGTPGTAKPVDALAGAGGTWITTGDLPGIIAAARALQIWQSGRRPPESALLQLEVRLSLLEAALDTRLVRAEVARRGLAPPPEAVEPLMRLARAGLSPETSTPLPLDAPQPYTGPAFEARYLLDERAFHEVAQDVLEASRLRDALLAEITPETLRAAFDSSRTRVTLDVVTVGRVPTPREIDDAVRQRPDELRAWYDAHPELFVTPTRRATRRVLVSPDGQDPAAVAAARSTAERLHAAAAAGTPFDALPMSPGVRVTPLRPLSRAQFAPAFDVALGALTPVVPHRDGFAFARPESETPGWSRAFHEPTVQREVAAALLREFDELPQARAVADEAAHLLTRGVAAARIVESLKPKAPGIRLEAVRTPAFARTANGVVPTIGLAPELFDAAFEARPERPVTTVHAVRQVYCVARVLQFEVPTEADWASDGARFESAYRAREARHVLRDWLSRQKRGPAAARFLDRRKLATLTPAAWGVRADGPEDPELPGPPGSSGAPESGAGPSPGPRP